MIWPGILLPIIWEKFHEKCTDSWCWRSDAFSRFEEEGIFNRETGQSFLDNILSRGGSEEPMELFKRFRGREPQLDAMLEHYGIKG